MAAFVRMPGRTTVARRRVGTEPLSAGWMRCVVMQGPVVILSLNSTIAPRRLQPCARSLGRCGAFYVAVFIAVAVLVQLQVGAYATDRGLTNDEAAHVVNSLLVLDYLRQAAFGNPLAFARDYYAHFPRVSIGHWPPMFYLLQAAVFALAGRSSAAALAFQAVIAGTAAGTAAILVNGRLGPLAALASGLMVLASPVLLFLLNAVMLDTVVALRVCWAALCWAALARQPGLVPAAGFAACSVAAILTKGDGFGLALLPLMHAAFTRSLRPLLSWQACGAAAVVAVLVLPWHLATFHMQASGFNYAFGWGYTGRALPAYASALVANLGVIGVAGLLVGLRQAARTGGGSSPDHTLAALASAVVAMGCFTLIAPADISPRYLVALMPCAVVVSVAGLTRIFASLTIRRAGLAVVAALALNAAVVLHWPHVAPFGMRGIAERILDDRSGNPLVLASGSTRAEGALIAAFDELDPRRTHYVLRGTQQLAGGNLMGSRYQTRFTTSAAASAWLADSGIGWLVVDVSPASEAMEHDRQLAAAVSAAGAGWTLCDSHRSADGEVRLYHRPGVMPTPDELRSLLRRSVPNG